MSKKIITSALPYPNGPLHLWHIAWVYLPADIYFRFCKLMGEDVIHVCGTDDHGVALEIASEKYGKPISELVWEYRKSYEIWMSKMGIDFTIFYGTDTLQHEEIAHQFFHALYSQWLLEKRTISQMYCLNCQKFLPDRYINGTCPICKNPDANWDQCENCGSMINPEDLIDPFCKTCKWSNLEMRSSDHLFFLLDRFEDRLKSWLETKTDWKANVISTSLHKWIKDSLQPRNYTRDIKSGISIPLEEFKNKTIYVWFEAPLGYISIAKKYFEDIWELWLFNSYWHDPSTQLIQFIWKDNIVFHSIIWPALLMAYNDNSADGKTKPYILPTNIPANEFLNLEGKKFSTSRWWAVWLDYMVQNYDPDFIRYYTSRVIPENQDSDFKRSEFQDRCNNLADSLWNLFNRVINLSIKYLDWQFVWQSKTELDKLPFIHKEIVSTFVDQVWFIHEQIIFSLKDYKFREWLTKLLELFALWNRFVDDTKPWELAKTDIESTKTILHLLWWYLACVSQTIYPYLPFTSKKISDILIESIYENTTYHNIWKDLDSFAFKRIAVKPDILFTKITDEQIAIELERLSQT